MATTFTSRCGNKAADAFVSDTLVGSTEPGPYLVIYAGPIPASVREALSGNTVLATIPLNAEEPFAPATQQTILSALYSVAVANAVDPVLAVANGDAAFYRQFDRNGTAVWQGVAGIVGSSADLQLTNIDLKVNVPVSLNSYSLRVPL